MTRASEGVHGHRSGPALTGQGAAHSAISILNGTMCGTGASLAVAGTTRAHWTPAADVKLVGAPDERLTTLVLERFGTAHVTIEPTFPSARGLKTSSAVAAALLGAASQATGRGAPTPEMCVDLCRRANVTLTGALDDQLAVMRPGLHLVDNLGQRVLAQWETPPWRVAVWVPEQMVHKSDVPRPDADVFATGQSLVERLLHGGPSAAPSVLTAMGRTMMGVYQEADLPVDQLPVDAALDAGALGSGMSGTGPAISGIFAEDYDGDLPVIEGGTWHWTEAL